MPKRIQRQRTKGWRMPEGAVYVGRPSRWGNPFRLGTPYALMRVPGATDPTAEAEYEGRISADGASHDYHHPGGLVTRCTVRYMTPQESVEHYRRLMTGDLTPSMRMAGWKPGIGRVHEITRDLAGRDLACWCPTWQPCHADVLLEIAAWDPDTLAAHLYPSITQPTDTPDSVTQSVVHNSTENASAIEKRPYTQED